jgi:hypothetical protein
MVGLWALALVVGLSTTAPLPEGAPDEVSAVRRVVVRPMSDDTPQPAELDEQSAIRAIDLRRFVVWSAIPGLVAGALLLYLAGRSEVAVLPQALDDV